MSRNTPEDRVQCSDTEALVGRDDDSMMRRGVGLQHDVAAYLATLPIVPASTEATNKLFTAEVAGKIHPVARTSLRTR